MKRRFGDATVRVIRQRYQAGDSGALLAGLHDVNRKVIFDIVHGRTYKTSPGPVSSGVRVCRHCGQRITGASA